MSFFRDRLKLFLYLSIGVLAALPVLMALPQHAAPQTPESQIVANVDPAQSTIHWTLGSSFHTVHGTFAIKSGRLQIDPATAKASGEIVADAASGRSGNDGRDKKMHKDVLESARFHDIVFRPDSVTGKLAAQGDSTVQLHGVFLLHGSEHELTVPVEANLSGDHWTGSAKFGVPFLDWGLKNPSTWLLKVDHVVNIELDLKGTLQTSPAH
ncbi:MAG TPA: YceI family protein [Candidatus Angelobacter sp.]|nr:YceI family protein [Candidatus Angelobacter sp.]